MKKAFARSVLVAACTVAMTVAASAAPLRPESVRHLSPAERAAAFKTAMGEQARARAARAEMDTLAPQLKKISVARQTTATRSGQQALVDLTIVDDWSGLEWGEISVARTDGGDNRAIRIPGTFGGKTFSGKLPIEFPASMPEGEYKIYGVYGADANGNNYYYDEAALAAYGNLTFKVGPLPSEDWVHPELRSGKILTPVIYVTRPSKGTYHHLPMARIELNVVDVDDDGRSGVTGVRRAELTFCSEKPGSSQCFMATLSQPDSIPYGTREATFLVGQELDEGYEAGDYALVQATIEDWAGMGMWYDRQSTDFSQIFGSVTKITVKH
jgi:hypothetical protein